jgi:hypothetical protein
MAERTRRERLEAEVLAFKAAILSGEAPEILVDVASVILDAQASMSASPSNGAIGERVSTGKPSSRIPTRDQGPVRAFRWFRRSIEDAVNGYESSKQRNWEAPLKDPREKARVWCCRVSCDQYQISLPKYSRSRKLGFVELAPVCNGRTGSEVCGGKLTDRP